MNQATSFCSRARLRYGQLLEQQLLNRSAGTLPSTNESCQRLLSKITVEIFMLLCVLCPAEAEAAASEVPRQAPHAANRGSRRRLLRLPVHIQDR